MKKILVIHGPNLNLLGQREKNIYGPTTLNEINALLKKLADRNKIELEILQSNHEGEIVDAIGAAKANQVHAILI
ncbi:MAG TPA: type II 3-dehydroquinate dehydratase, partial [Candidatus Omnitrophota bacterium]|nr:type II 3-dehydroquinate dehydratase [Candidatus Omnitrophota bacterium]